MAFLPSREPGVRTNAVYLASLVFASDMIFSICSFDRVDLLELHVPPVCLSQIVRSSWCKRRRLRLLAQQNDPRERGRQTLQH